MAFPTYTTYYPPRPAVDTCDVCGAVVHDKVKHDNWHSLLGMNFDLLKKVAERSIEFIQKLNDIESWFTEDTKPIPD